MKRPAQSIEKLNEKCMLIESLGFTINHEDSDVEFNGYPFDFSAVACDAPSIVYTALKKMLEHGRADGKLEIQEGFRKLLGIDGDQE